LNLANQGDNIAAVPRAALERDTDPRGRKPSVTTTTTSTVRGAVWRSPAKVNLCLRVRGRRGDGYHLLDSIFVPVDLGDRITLAVAALRTGADSAVAVRWDHPGVPADGTNLAARAATLLLAECGCGADVRIAIEKTIPPGSGLGGGSGNAATVLAGMNALLGLGVPAVRLRELALRLGADVPFFLCGRPARVRGIGEDVEPITGWPALRLVVAIPRLAVATAWAFRAFAQGGCTPPGDEPPALAPAGDEPARLAAGEAPAPDLLVNDLERVVLPAFPAIAELKAQLLAAGATAAVMSGTGSAVIGIAPSAAAAERIAAAIQRVRPEVRVHAVGVFAGPSIADPSG
jgi:4-diphosphocytidyl-2-C-methyl-D-erythritol kinase